MDNRLNVKDLINVGVFTAIYFLIFFTCGMLGYIPFLLVVVPFLMPLVTGIPFMLFLTKVNKFGMITIMGIIVSLLMFATGHGWLVIATGVICGILADLILKSGGYKSWKRTLIGFCVFSEWVMGAMLPIWIMRDSYFAHLRAGYGNQYADTLMSLTSNWMFAVLAVSVIVGGIIGANIGRATLKKHFKRAGIV